MAFRALASTGTRLSRSAASPLRDNHMRHGRCQCSSGTDPSSEAPPASDFSEWVARVFFNLHLHVSRSSALAKGRRHTSRARSLLLATSADSACPSRAPALAPWSCASASHSQREAPTCSTCRARACHVHELEPASSCTAQPGRALVASGALTLVFYPQR